VFEIYEGHMGKWHWRILDRNGMLVGESLAEYETSTGARDAIAAIKKMGVKRCRD